MNFKKISLLLVALSIVFGTETFARKFSAGPVGEDGKTIRKTRVVKPRAIRQNRTKRVGAANNNRSRFAQRRKPVATAATGRQNRTVRRSAVRRPASVATKRRAVR